MDDVKEMTSAEAPAPRIEDTTLKPLGFCAMVNLRGPAGDAGFTQAVEGALGLALPGAANRFTQSGERRIIWLGPDEWLIMAPDGEARAIEAHLRAARPDDPWLAVTDVSDNMTGFALAGPEARATLAKGCALDLHPRVFTPGQCAQTLLARTRMLLLQTGPRPSYEIWVRNSFARYAGEWLEDALGELRRGDCERK